VAKKMADDPSGIEIIERFISFDMMSRDSFIAGLINPVSV